jgi:hypothetical protein
MMMDPISVTGRIGKALLFADKPRSRLSSGE